MPPMATATKDSAAAARRFAVACGVLSQYVKAAGPVPMPLLACGGAARMGDVHEPDSPPADGAQQLTIFYGGRVVVLDGCTPARAAELIRYASAAPAPAPRLVEADMLIARKVSLHRFLSERKGRFVPEVGRWENTAAPPPEKKAKRAASSWLALGSLGDMHAQ